MQTNLTLSAKKSICAGRCFSAFYRKMQKITENCIYKYKQMYYNFISTER